MPTPSRDGPFTITMGKALPVVAPMPYRLKGGSLIGRHDWGVRRMTFEIDHRPEADYHLFQFEADVPLLERLDHMLKITDGVLRFRIIKLRAGTPPPPEPKPAEARAREPRGSERVAARAAADAG